MNLTEENYYGKQANEAFFSVSQFKQLCSCEASAMAQLRGEYTPPVSKAMLVGSFVDNYVDGTLDKFKSEHPEIFTLKKQLRAEFKRANEIIEVIKQNQGFNKFLQGEKQKILTGELFGAKWKIKMDSFSEGLCITDLKVVALTRKLPYWRYDWQGAVYQEIAYQNGFTDAKGNPLPFYLAVVSKEKVPDLNIFQVEQSQLDLALNEIGEKMPRFIEVKQGLVEPKRCENCEYCKKTRNVKVRGYKELLV